MPPHNIEHTQDDETLSLGFLRSLSGTRGLEQQVPKGGGI